jgi:hypothetical protein
MRFDQLYLQLVVSQVGAVKHTDGIFRLGWGAHFNKGKASGVVGVTVFNQGYPGYLTRFGE